MFSVELDDGQIFYGENALKIKNQCVYVDGDFVGIAESATVTGSVTLDSDMSVTVVGSGVCFHGGSFNF